MNTVKELKEIFESSTAEAVFYSSKVHFKELYVGPINEAPEEFDDYFFDLYDATWETKETYSYVSYEICVHDK